MLHSMPVRVAVDEYRRANRQKSPNTQRNAKQRLLLFTEWCEERGLLCETITSRDIRAFLEDVEKIGCIQRA